MRPTSPNLTRSALLAAASLLSLSQSASAQTWDGGAASGLWSAAANWSADTLPASGSSLIFAGTVQRSTTNDRTAGISYAGIQFNTLGWTLAGNSIGISGTIQHNLTGSGANNISLPLVLNGATTVSVTGTYRIDLTGDISGTGSLEKAGANTVRVGTQNVTSTNSYSGSTTISAGTFDAIGNNVIPGGAGKGDLTISTGATLNINNSNQAVNGLNGGGNVTRNGTNTRTFSVGNGDASGSFSGNFTTSGGSSALTKTGTGSQVFGGTVTAPAINVNGGVAEFNGTTTGNTTVNSSGTLAGAGTIVSIATINGGLRPDSTPTNNTSRLTFSNALSLASTATTTFDFAGANFSAINANAATTLGGLLSLNFTGVAQDGVYDLINFGSTITGSFSNVSLAGSYTGSLVNDGFGVWSGIFDGKSFSFSQASGDLTIAVPEPATCAALAGVLALGFAAWRRRKA